VYIHRFTERRLRAVFEVKPNQHYWVNGEQMEYESPVEVITDWAIFGGANTLSAFAKAGILETRFAYQFAEDWAVFDERVREVECRRIPRNKMIICYGHFLPAEHKRDLCGNWDLH